MELYHFVWIMYLRQFRLFQI